MVSPDNPLVTPNATFEDFIREQFIFHRWENESDIESSIREQNLIEMHGLKPRKIITLLNRDSCYTVAELGKGIIISSDINRITSSSILKKYSTGKYEIVICLLRASEDNQIIEKYARCLQAVF